MIPGKVWGPYINKYENNVEFKTEKEKWFVYNVIEHYIKVLTT